MAIHWIPSLIFADATPFKNGTLAGSRRPFCRQRRDVRGRRAELVGMEADGEALGARLAACSGKNRSTGVPERGAGTQACETATGSTPSAQRISVPDADVETTFVRAGGTGSVVTLSVDVVDQLAREPRVAGGGQRHELLASSFVDVQLLEQFPEIVE